MDSPMLFILILICIGVWWLVFFGAGKIIAAVKEGNSKLDDIADKLGDVEDKLPEVDYEARDEAEQRKDRQRWHLEDMESIKRLPEAVSAAQNRGLTVELGSKNDVRADDWGKRHLPACRVTRGGSTRYYFPVDFVNFALQDRFLESADMRDGKYPYNQPGQAQLEKLFRLGVSED